jgi:transposase-like protein
VLAKHTRAVGTRLRRDFGTVLRFVQAHALLHQLNREVDEQGRIIATLGDYHAVYPLVQPLVEQGLRRAVRPAVREMVELVQRYHEERKGALSIREAARLLGIDPATASRRAREAIEVGLLINEEEKPRKPARLVPGAPLPEEPTILPPPEVLEGVLRGEGEPSLSRATVQQQPANADGSMTEAVATGVSTGAQQQQGLREVVIP